MSVLFADLVGFTARSESLDPEDVEAILSPYHARLRSELERHGARVEKFIGDAVMAVFGAPIAHEDDPERAVRAAIAIRDWIRDEGELEVRIAVNTGVALVSLEPSPGAERGLVAGDVVNTASRLQGAAPVNGILVGETTYNATAPAIEYRQAPAVESKGKSAPVPVWEAIEARSRFGADVAQRPRTPLVGREQELALLLGAQARVRRERSPQLVTLAGVPGIGKSRLVHELFSAIEAQPDLISWRQGRCPPYGDGVAFWALGEIVKAHAGILEGEPDEQVAEKLRAAVDEAVPDAEEARWVVRQLGPLVGLAEAGESGGERRTESFAAWRRFFEGLAERRPLVLVFEDLHWADEGLLEFIDHLVDWAASVPILVVATTRPELLTRRPNWGGGKPNASTISLTPLSEQETATLVRGLLERAVLPAEVHAALLDRAGGNPLYAEEFARIVLDRGPLTDGAADLPLPESVQGLIAARLDTLTDEEKSLLQNASVIGKVFWLGAAAALADDADRRDIEELLHGLDRKQFVRRERRSSVDGDTEYAFVHGLVREVAYGQIPRSDRAEKHRRAAGWIEALGRPEDQAELLAHHYVSAIETARAARQDVGGLEAAARYALRDAGDRAAALGSFEQARRHYDRALEWWPADADRARLQLAAARVTFYSIETNHEELTAARDVLLEAGDLAAAAEAESLAASALWMVGRGEEVRRRAEAAAKLAEGLPVSGTKASVYANLCRLNWLGGREELAFTLGRQAISIADELGLPLVRATVLTAFGTHHATHGVPSGLEELEEAVRIYEELNSPMAQRPYNNLADTLYRLGDLDRAAQAAERMREAGERFARSDWNRWADSHVMRALYHSGGWDEALGIANRWIDDLEAGEGHYLEAMWRVIRGRIRHARGDRSGAAADATRSVESGKEIGDAQVQIPTLAFRAWLDWSSGGPGADELALQAAAVCRRFLQGIADDWWPDLALVLGATGHEDELTEVGRTMPNPSAWLDAGLALGRHEPVEAAEIFRSMGALPWEAEARLLAAKDGLDADLPAAIEFFRKVQASAYLAEAEELLATTRSA